MAKDIILRAKRMGDFRFNDLNIVLTSDVILPGESGYSGSPDQGPGLYVVADGCGPVGLAFADCLQDALNKLADADLLDSFLVEPADYDSDRHEAGCYTALGNEGMLYDLTADYWGDVVILDRQHDVDFLIALAEARGAKLDHLGQL